MTLPLFFAVPTRLLAAPPEPQPASRAEVVMTDGSSILYAYDRDDEITAEITVSDDGLQASFDGLFLDASLARDGTITVECGSGPCSDADLLQAHTQLSSVADVLIQTSPAELKLRCALTIAFAAIACSGGGVGCLAGYYLAACECMGTVTVKGKDICAEIL